MRLNRTLASWVLGFSYTLTASQVTAAVVTANDFGSHLMLSIRGDIEIQDAALVRSYLAKSKPDAHVSLFIQSKGGDVETAMEIGRALRAVNARVSTDKCFSACVLVFIGGVNRSVSSSAARGWGLGIHRLYFASLSPKMASSDIARRRRAANEGVKSYISSMNVSGLLFEMMEAIPPEKMRLLTRDEVDALGLAAPDPVWDETNVAKEAAYYAITSAEFRRRRASLQSLCPDPDWSKPTSVDKEQARINCEEAARWNLPVRDYLSRSKAFDRWVAQAFGQSPRNVLRTPSEVEVAKRCRIVTMTSGNAACAR